TDQADLQDSLMQHCCFPDIVVVGLASVVGVVGSVAAAFP
ncbi:hypothetical protein A2U01_0095098, partial [Trifolium medium]|nr:hypothetical protein [Trifolium medium]